MAAEWPCANSRSEDPEDGIGAQKVQRPDEQNARRSVKGKTPQQSSSIVLSIDSFVSGLSPLAPDVNVLSCLYLTEFGETACHACTQAKADVSV